MAFVVIFWGAFLAFLVQPMVGNTLLPIFGGSASVWSACLASFQIMLVAGYFYAHKSAKAIQGGRKAAWGHVGLLILSAGWICFVATHRGLVFSWIGQSCVPALGSVLAVLLLVLVPYVLLASNSSLVQELSGGRYGLYAISNLGSFCGLLAYPFVFELGLSLTGQWLVFAALMFVYAVLFALLVPRARVKGEGLASRREEVDVNDAPPSFLSYFWLAFISCYLLNAVSVHLCTDITPVPMLWVLLLSLYLVSYVIAFTEKGASIARLGGVALVPLCAVAFWRYGRSGAMSVFLTELLISSLILFLGGWIVHARLFRMRPTSVHLTRYYLMIALGGAAGGAACSFVMPLVTTTTAEYPIAIVLLLAVVLFDVRDLAKSRFVIAQALLLKVRIWAFGVLTLLAVLGVVKGYVAKGHAVFRYRNFYGIGSVLKGWITLQNGSGYWVNELRSGETIHGFQKVEGEWKGQMATSYYSENAGGLAVTSHPKYKNKLSLRVGVCGMGIGTMATYARNGDFYRFFEINPAVEKIARNSGLFSFLSKSLGKTDVVVDDARRALEKEDAAGEPKYDVLVVDVFSGDAIPVHMATREAVALYLKRLEDDGILAFHISSWHIDFRPMIKAIAKEFSLVETTWGTVPTQYGMAAQWAIFSRVPLAVELEKRTSYRIDLESAKTLPMMSDEFHSIIPYLTLDHMLRGE